jgi:hypothetical protein
MECSGTQTDSKPSSSHRRAMDTGSIVLSDSIANIPIFISSSRQTSIDMAVELDAFLVAGWRSPDVPYVIMVAREIKG